MAARDYIVRNFWWKLVSLLLAIFTWFSIQLARFGSGHDLVFSKKTVKVLRNPADSSIYQIDPPTVDVKVRFEPGVLKNLSERDIQVYVDLISQPELSTVVRSVRVSAPEGVNTQVEPAAVSVEKVNVPPESISNSLSKP